MLLTKDVNVLIEATKYALFKKNTAGPLLENKEDKLKIEFHRPSTPSELYEMSVSFFGPWQNNIDVSVLLSQMFNGYEKEILNIQKSGDEDQSFATIFVSELTPEPTEWRINLFYDIIDKEWSQSAIENCETQEEITEDITKFVFKISCNEALDEILAENFKQFLSKTCFMFYDVTIEFNYWGESFQRTIMELPVAYRTVRRLERFLKCKLGKAVSSGSAWICQDNDEITRPFEVTAVAYGVPGTGKRLPVWVLGPSGIPPINFNKTFTSQLVCQGAELPIDHVQFDPPSGLPPPDICLDIPSNNVLSTDIDYYLIIVLALPIKYRVLEHHVSLVNEIGPVSQHYWEAIVETLTEVIQNPLKIENDDDNNDEEGDLDQKMLDDFLAINYPNPKNMQHSLYLLGHESDKDCKPNTRKKIKDEDESSNSSSTKCTKNKKRAKESDDDEDEDFKPWGKIKHEDDTSNSDNPKNSRPTKRSTRNSPNLSDSEISSQPVKKRKTTKKKETSEADDNTEQLDTKDNILLDEVQATEDKPEEMLDAENKSSVSEEQSEKENVQTSEQLDLNNESISGKAQSSPKEPQTDTITEEFDMEKKSSAIEEQTLKEKPNNDDENSEKLDTEVISISEEGKSVEKELQTDTNTDELDKEKKSSVSEEQTLKEKPKTGQVNTEVISTSGGQSVQKEPQTDTTTDLNTEKKSSEEQTLKEKPKTEENTEQLNTEGFSTSGKAKNEPQTETNTVELDTVKKSSVKQTQSGKEKPKTDENTEQVDTENKSENEIQ